MTSRYPPYQPARSVSQALTKDSSRARLRPSWTAQFFLRAGWTWPLPNEGCFAQVASGGVTGCVGDCEQELLVFCRIFDLPARRRSQTWIGHVILNGKPMLTTIVDTQDLRISVIAKPSSSAILCFTGIGHALGGIDVQTEEFVRASSTKGHAVFISDKQRSWGNNLSFDEIKNTILPYTKGKRLFAIGNSMGGFLAILSSRFFDISSVIAFVPQYSVMPTIVPGESRWPHYINLIKQFHFPSLEGSFNDTTQYYILSGSDFADRRHWSLMPSKRNVHKLIFDEAKHAHQTANFLKERGKLYDVIADCLSGRPGEEIIRRNALTDVVAL